MVAGAWHVSLIAAAQQRQRHIRRRDKKAGLLSLHPTQTAAWADFDNDGWLDLFVGHETTGPEKHPSQLFHNNHDGTFTEVGAQTGWRTWAS